MALSLYNTFSKKEEKFTPLREGKVTMYTCGPTVYGRPHVGNYSSFLMADLLRRWLEVGHGLQVTHVKNITDVGHLVADRDTGEDKIEKQAREEFGEVSMQSVIGIARKYETQYLEDEKALNMREPEHRPRATDFIDQMRTMIETLLEKKKAYVTDDGIYFAVTSFQGYGALSGNTVDNLSAGARVEVDAKKKHPADFALWKFCVGINEHHVLRWPSPKSAEGDSYPEGFPGWHIECSAMSRALLGDQIDLHTGGEDNIFPHHECEIAQSESVTGKKPFVGLWLHKRRIEISMEETLRQAQGGSLRASQKMSKSLGNVLGIPDIIAKGYSPLDLRYYFLSVHYRTNLKFTWRGMDDAHKARKKILEWMDDVEKIAATGDSSASAKDLQDAVENFSAALNSDLNTPGALAAVFDAMNGFRAAGTLDASAVDGYKKFAKTVRDVFGCFEPEINTVPVEVEHLITLRATARAEKNFGESDRLRDEIKKLGYEVRDKAGDQEVKKL